jgi:hypothetical protein
MKKVCLGPCAFLICLMFVFVVSNCKKAGSGGKAEVAVFVKHHERLIPAAMVYVKYNAKEFPGADVSKYDLSAVCGNIGEARGHTHIKDLRYGYYYFYSVGYDSAISQTVTGGIALHIKYSERKKEIDLDVPVTE